MKYSFLMCVHKLQPFLDVAIDSVLSQSDPEFDFVIVANGSDDLLWEKLQSYTDPRIRLFRTSIAQLAFNLNFGLNIIGRGYALRMDADDVCLPKRLAITKKRLEEFGWPDVMGSQAELIDEQDLVIGRERRPGSNRQIRSQLWRTCPVIHPSCALRVESVFRLGGYLGGFMSEDYDLWIRASRAQDFVFRNAMDTLLQYRMNPNQARRNSLGYAEVSGHMLREALLGTGFKFLLGSALSAVKCGVLGR